MQQMSKAPPPRGPGVPLFPVGTWRCGRASLSRSCLLLHVLRWPESHTSSGLRGWGVGPSGAWSLRM